MKELGLGINEAGFIVSLDADKDVPHFPIPPKSLQVEDITVDRPRSSNPTFSNTSIYKPKSPPPPLPPPVEPKPLPIKIPSRPISPPLPAQRNKQQDLTNIDISTSTTSLNAPVLNEVSTNMAATSSSDTPAVKTDTSTSKHSRRNRNQNSTQDQPVTASKSSLSSLTSLTALDPDLTEPEPLTDLQHDLYSDMIQVYGSFLVRCLLSRRFKLREKALEDVSKRLDAWNRRMYKDSKKRKEAGAGHNRGRSIDGKAKGKDKLKKRSARSKSLVKRDDKESGDATIQTGDDVENEEDVKKPHHHKKRKSKKSKSKVRNNDEDDSDEEADGDVNSREEDESEGGEVELIRISWVQEIPAKHIDLEDFITGTFSILRKGMDDSREKVAMLSLSLWDQFTS